MPRGLALAVVLVTAARYALSRLTTATTRSTT
jgi:hypothetical protein